MPLGPVKPCPYSILGVSPFDDFSAIRAAWRRLVKTYHPDVWFGSEREANARLLAVNDAYDRLALLHKRVQEAALQSQRKSGRPLRSGAGRVVRQRLVVSTPSAIQVKPVGVRVGTSPAADQFLKARQATACRSQIRFDTSA